MSLKVTEQEKRRVKNTARVFVIIFLVCAILAGVFVALIPRTKQIKTIGANEEVIESFIDSHDGETYFLQSENLLCEYDSFTGEKLGEVNLTAEIKKAVKPSDVAVAGSFAKWRVSAFSAETDDYFIVSDINGNIFKLVKNEQGKLEVCADYCLIESKEGGLFSKKEIKGLDYLEGTDRMFVLILENNFFYVEEYDMTDLTQGALKRKFLWDVQLEEEDGFKKIQALKAATGVLAFYAHGDYLYFVKQGGGVLRLSTELIDGVDELGQPRDFFPEAEAIYAERENLKASEEFVALREYNYNDYIARILAAWCVEYAVREGVDFQIKKGDTWQVVNEDYVEEFYGADITNAMWKDSATKEDIIEKVKEIFASSVDGDTIVYDSDDLQARYIFVNGKTGEEKIVEFPQVEDRISANAYAEIEGEKFLDVVFPYPAWIKSYSDNESAMFVDKAYLNEQYYASFKPGESVIRGMVLSKPNDALYYTNASDGYLYVVDLEGLESAENGTAVASLAKRIDTIHCGKGQTFSDFGNGLGYNKFANTLYLKYANERKLTIVDINVKDIKAVGEYKVLSTFTGSFDMFSISGDKNNEVTHVMHQVTKVDKKGIDHNYLYVCTYEPEKFENKPVITLLFVIFLILAIVTFFISLWLVLNTRTEAGVKKIVFIAKDTKKNKFVYLALVPFIVMLIMFCYYEAIGAIAMSFFDYTREKPAWIWNNFANYIKIFNSSNFLSSVFNMLFFLAADIILCIIPPIIFAILLILIRNKVTSNWIRSLMFIPGIIPSIAGMLIWRVGIYGDTGILNQIVMACGGKPVNWLLNKDYARWSLIMMGFPFVGGYLIFYGGMMNIPSEYHEAGKLEGLGTIKRFLKIDIPLIKPQIKYIFITTFIASVQNFARTHILKSTVVATPVQTMYTMMTEQADYGMSSAYATLIFIFLFAAIATNFKMQKQDAMGADL